VKRGKKMKNVIIKKKRLYIKNDYDLYDLKGDYNFFYHMPSKTYWLVLNKDDCFEKNIEVSLVVDVATRELKLYTTNDHKKLPSIYSTRYNKENYLSFEEQIDAYSFSNWIPITTLFKIIKDDIVEIR
jgi:hypothetical protein